jgi:hypothetical protein
MTKFATRKLIELRERHSKFRLKVVDVKQIGGGIPNDCAGNASNEADKNPLNSRKPGWLVMPFDKVSGTTQIIQHWWNGDPENNHFDTTPLIERDVEYVLDPELMTYFRKHYELLSSMVAASLLLHQDGKVFAVYDDIHNHRHVVPINDLSVETIFSFYQNPKI